MDKVKIAQIQMSTGFNKEKNIEKAEEMIRSLKGQNVDIIVLPEMFNTPYNTKYFKHYGEHRNESGTLKRLKSIAGEMGAYVFGGSIPELDDDGKLYNTCFILDRKGEVIGSHRKMHLFDVNIKGGIFFKESDVLSAGNKVTVVDTEFGKIAAGICYDIRFPEYARIAALEGAHMMILPGAFNSTTGPKHWEVLLRARAIDNQMFIAAASPAKDVIGVYSSYGHSMIVDPWGDVQGELSDDEGILIEEIDMSKVKSVRSELPLLRNRRRDLYDVRMKNNRDDK